MKAYHLQHDCSQRVDDASPELLRLDTSQVLVPVWSHPVYGAHGAVVEGHNIALEDSFKSAENVLFLEYLETMSRLIDGNF